MTRGIVSAYRIKGSELYKLTGDTYSYRAIIAEMGGVFNKEGKSWTVARKVVDHIRAAIQMRVLVEAHCHRPEEEIVINEGVAKSGSVWLSCSMCDRSMNDAQRVVVLKIIGEHEVDA